MNAEPSDEELIYHTDSVKLRYDVYGDAIEDSFRNNENPFQEVASIYLRAISYIKNMELENIDMENHFETDDTLSAVLKKVPEAEEGYLKADDPHNATLQILISNMSEYTKKFLKKHKLV